jgi:hypothetical protein
LDPEVDKLLLFLLSLFNQCRCQLALFTRLVLQGGFDFVDFVFELQVSLSVLWVLGFFPVLMGFLGLEA